MRLTKVKLAGFKSFVDPTTVQFPSNLTGVVGPNGCGKSNVIDAVRWVMGELSARHLRGDSMADVIFNGSSARKPVGSASVELVFDNSDGKIGGTYAGYNEISLKRQVSRDGSSTYLINGARCRRKDITQLFLGTGLGARSYAIIEQGMISRVIEARADDMRQFVEEAAGISRYKERRRETESRVLETRENLERLQDVRDEVEKQIRHLTRQATTARKYQDFKNTERRLGAELLALKLRDIDSGAEVTDRAVRERELQMQQALAEQRSAEAAVDKQREYHTTEGERLATVQGRYYELGAEVVRNEQSLQHTRELRERQRSELAQATSVLAELGGQIERDETERVRLEAEIAELTPGAAAAQGTETARASELGAADQTLQEWQQGWEEFNRMLGGTQQTTQVERARIEQLEDQLRRLHAHADRLAIERDQLLASDTSVALQELSERESSARQGSAQLATQLRTVLDDLQRLRADQLSAEARIEAARAERETTRTELMSLDALQKAALGAADREATGWLKASELDARARVAQSLVVMPGWERAVETVLGDYLEAVCVDNLDEFTTALANLGNGDLMLVEPGVPVADPGENSLAAKLQGPVAVLRRLARVRTSDSLAQALHSRASLADGESIVTATGEWIGRDWLRVTRGADARAGVIEREHRLKTLRTTLGTRESAARHLDDQLARLRASVTEAEQERDAIQTRIQVAHREHVSTLGQLEATRARSEESALRRERLDIEALEVNSETGRAQEALRRAAAQLEQASLELERLDERRRGLEGEREELRAAATQARAAAQQAQARAREILIQLEGRRSTASSMAWSLSRMHEQRIALQIRHDDLEVELRDGDTPIRELEARLNELLSRRLDSEGELAAARRALEGVETDLRALDEKRVAAEQRVASERGAMEQARFAAQESRVRRESLAEQFAATRFELAELLAALAPEAAVPDWETRLTGITADLEKLGQVNLAAIDELKEQSERKVYLDSQYKDLTDALDTLEQAMKRIDKETRSRFEDTFNRINVGLQEKFPRLFGGGHAYLELVGDDVLAAGVAIMARPPGKRNSTISQLSGGEKALTAVALVFSIFDLNPAPFCLLDEVDAPLDEHNVGRFCDIVREMATRVQFIFITHNKATMELASQLVGVTMNEPGVSRLVAVDVDEAVRLAAV
ncbi:MAG: chromosome segregation protein SMC [Steroidobacteraceae bacterium]